MTLKELLALIQEKAKDIDFGIDLEATLTDIINEASKGLSEKNTELLSKLKTAQDRLKNVPDDFDLDEYNKMIQTLKDVDVSKLKTDEAVEAVKTQMASAHKVELEKVGETVKALTQALETHMIDGAATIAITEAGGNASLLLPHLKNQLKMVQKDDGTYGVAVVDGKGEQRFSAVNAGSYMEIPELVAEFKNKDTYKPVFAADNTGGGARRRSGGDDTPNPWIKGPDFNMTEQAKILNADPGRAQALQAAAKTANEAQRQGNAA